MHFLHEIKIPADSPFRYVAREMLTNPDFPYSLHRYCSVYRSVYLAVLAIIRVLSSRYIARSSIRAEERQERRVEHL